MLGALAPEVTQDVILGLTFFGVGLALYLAVLNFSAAWRERDIEQLGYGLARVGTAIVIILIAELVSKVPEVPLTWRAVLYSVGLLMLSTGFVLIALGHRRRRGQHRAEP